MKYAFHTDLPTAADTGDELSIQVRLRSRCKMLAPRMRLIAVPHAGKRTAWAAMKAKNEGMAKGFPDLIAIAPGFIAFLELKDRTGTLSPEQIDMLNFLQSAGFPTGCFRSVGTAIAFLQQHGAPFMAAAA